jgi:hypothetical protein
VVEDTLHDRPCPREKSPRPAHAAIRLDLGEPGRIVHEVDLGQHDQPARHLEQLDDREVLARLRHDAFVGGDDEQHGVDPADAGEHVADEALVPRHVDDADAAARGRDQRREAEVDRDAAFLLFLQAIGVDARQAADERGLAVVDVAGGADDGEVAAHRGAATPAGVRSSRRAPGAWRRGSRSRGRGGRCG